MPDPPPGTVTLLFTDIEGSTQLLQQLGARYPEVLAQHRALLRAAFSAYGGSEVDTQGDAFFVVFAQATLAVAAAVAAQNSLAIHAWPEGGVVRVRMGLHTGEPVRTAEGYTGLDVYRAARIAAACHGGQVILSELTADLVRYDLPAGLSLVDRGTHRLKDLTQAEHLFQLLILGLPADFPPLRTLESRPNNLPIQPTALVGREQEIEALRELFKSEKARLVTLTGAGGSGKTRLALEIARRLHEQFAGGAYFVALASLTDPNLVAPAIAERLGLQESQAWSPNESLQNYLGGKDLLLVLDNFEHVLSAAPLVAELLTSCLGLRVLVTSRAPLQVRGEKEFLVRPLAVPDVALELSCENLAQYAAVQLFVQRAVDVRGDFVLTEDNAPAVAEICRRLDGLPLAIELAAARVKLLPPQALQQRLEQRLPLLTGGARDLPARQRSLHATIAWSYDLLTAEEQALFRRLSVFADGWTLEAAEAVCATDGNLAAVLDGMASLLDKSLVQHCESEDHEPRLRMLETVREFALDELVTSDEARSIQGRHADHFLTLSETVEPKLVGPEKAVWLARLETEHDNIRVALGWFGEQRMAEAYLRLAASLGLFWNARGHWSEGRHCLEAALVGTSGSRSLARAKALRLATWLARRQGDHATAQRLGEESLAIARELGDKVATAAALNELGYLALQHGDHATMRILFEEALTLARAVEDKGRTAELLRGLGILAQRQGDVGGARTLLEGSLGLRRELGDKDGVSWSLHDLGEVALSQGDYATARALYEEGLAIARGLGGKWHIAQLLNDLGRLCMIQGEYATARFLHEETLTIARELGSRNDIASALSRLGTVAMGQGDHAIASQLLQESLATFSELGNMASIALCLVGLGGVALAQVEHERAAQLYGAAAAIRDTLGFPLPPYYHAGYDRSIATLRARLAEQAFAAAWEEGYAMVPEQAIAYALREKLLCSTLGVGVVPGSQALS